jgi:hypothetical protein
LDRLDWHNVFAAGGAVLACMLTNDKCDVCSCLCGRDARIHSDDADNDENSFGSSDIDLFVHGVSVEAANEKLRAIYECVRASVANAQVS